MSAAGFQFDTSYARLPEAFFVKTPPMPVAAARMALFNEALARDLGLDTEVLSSPEGAKFLTGNRVAGGSEPLAMAYAGHQFGSFVPEIDVKETDKEVRVTAELPGIEEKDIDVTLTEGVLTIKGEKREEHDEEKGDFFRSERRYGMFERSLALPNGIDANGAKASFKKGVLKVTLPKTAEAQSNRRRIAIEG